MKKQKPLENLQTKKYSKKAQIETMGLLIVVILISLIIFFVLSFSLKSKENAPAKEDFGKQQAISNFGTTMLETTEPCAKRTIRELLTDCAFRKQINCGSKDSCLLAEDAMGNILDKTLNQWGYDYNLTVTTETDTVVISKASGCNNSSKKSAKEVTPFGTTYGTMSLTLRTCDS